MKPFDPFSQIGKSNENPSIPELLFRERKKISEQEYHVGTSVWVADNANQYKARPYPQPSDAVRSYVEGRLYADRAPDRELGRRLGTWVYTVTMIREQNRADLMTLEWSREKCAGVGLTGKVDAIKQVIRSYSESVLPAELYERAVAVQARDAAARRISARGDD